MYELKLCPYLSLDSFYKKLITSALFIIVIVMVGLTVDIYAMVGVSAVG